VLIAAAQSDPEAKAWVGGFLQGLEKRGWSEDRNLHIDYRFALAGAQAQLFAKELVALQPDVIFAMPTPAVAALQGETREIPIVFAAWADPIGSGFIASLPRPGGNMTGVMQYEPSVVGKWLSMLKDIAPRLARVGLVINPKTAPFYNYYLRPAESLSPSFGIELVPIIVETPHRDRARHRVVRARAERRSARAPGYYDLRPSRPHHCASGPAQFTSGLLISCCRIGRWSHVVRNRPCRHVSTGGFLRRSHPARR